MSVFGGKRIQLKWLSEVTLTSNLPHYAGNEQHDSEHDDQLGQDAQFLRSGITHGAAPACLMMQRNPTWLVEVSTGLG
jgi:hypothetical protein